MNNILDNYVSNQKNQRVIAYNPQNKLIIQTCDIWKIIEYLIFCINNAICACSLNNNSEIIICTG